MRRMITEHRARQAAPVGLFVAALCAATLCGCSSEEGDSGNNTSGGAGGSGGSAGSPSGNGVGGGGMGGSSSNAGASSTGGSGTGGSSTGGSGTGGAGTGGSGTGGASTGGTGGSSMGGSGGAGGQKSQLSFFVTSANPGEMGGNLGGLAGADAYCEQLAAAVGAGDREWRAYLSAAGMNAKDRIGMGPWTNAKGVVVATSVADLHSDSNKLGKENTLTEKGEILNGRGDNPNRHDILTGSNADGTAAAATCMNWTSNAATDVSGRVGHHDKDGGGEAPMSWNSAHDSRGCSIEALRGTGGDGRFYCFAADPPPAAAQ